MTLTRPYFMQAAEGDTAFEYSANEFRTFWGVLFNTEGVGNTNGANLATTNDLKVSQRSAGANMSVDVLGGIAVILGDDVSFQGFYVCFSGATENLVVPSPPVSGTRIHRVVARVRDKLHDGTQTTYDWVLEVVEDTDGSGPPALPDSAISLATVTVASTDSSVLDSAITDTRESAVVGSGMTAGRYVSSDSARPANPRESEIVYRTDKGCFEFWDESDWREIPRRDGGGSAWSTYTPAWTSTGTAPAIGNGSLVGRYERVGRTVHVSAKVIGGSTTTWGSGHYVLSLPVAAYEADDGQVLNMQVRDVSSGQLYPGHARILTGGTTASLWVSGPDADLDQLQQGGTITLATGDYIRIWGTYEAAS